LARFLASQGDFDVVSECATTADTLEILGRLPVDVVLADFDLGEEHGNLFIPAARNAGYRGGILILTEIVDGRESAATLKLGGSGIFLKSKPLDRLLDAIRLVALGESWVDETVVRLLAQSYPQHVSLDKPLTPAEQEVLDGLLQGLTSRTIGTRIGRSEAAVKAILQQLFAKTGVRSRSQLVRAALEGSLRHVDNRQSCG